MLTTRVESLYLVYCDGFGIECRTRIFVTWEQWGDEWGTVLCTPCRERSDAARSVNRTADLHTVRCSEEECRETGLALFDNEDGGSSDSLCPDCASRRQRYGRINRCLPHWEIYHA